MPASVRTGCLRRTERIGSRALVTALATAAAEASEEAPHHLRQWGWRDSASYAAWAHVADTVTKPQLPTWYTAAKTRDSSDSANHGRIHHRVATSSQIPDFSVS